MTTLLRQFKENKKRVQIEGKRKDWTYGEILALKMWEMAIKGNEQIMKYVCNRLDGMPLARHEIEATIDEPLMKKMREANKKKKKK